MTDRRKGNDSDARPEDKALAIRKRVLERDHRRLKVPLTAEELRAASRRIGSVMRQRLQEEAAFEEQRDEHKAKMTAFDKEIAELGVVLDTETTEADVECVTEVNWDEGTAETKRTDTHEVIATRPLTAAERQEEMFRSEHVGRKPRGKSGEARP